MGGTTAFLRSMLGWVESGLSQQFDSSDTDLVKLSSANSFKRTQSELNVADDSESDAELLRGPDRNGNLGDGTEVRYRSRVQCCNVPNIYPCLPWFKCGV